jgi:hypothetical protein
MKTQSESAKSNAVEVLLYLTAFGVAGVLAVAIIILGLIFG